MRYPDGLRPRYPQRLPSGRTQLRSPVTASDVLVTQDVTHALCRQAEVKVGNLHQRRESDTVRLLEQWLKTASSTPLTIRL
jgi:hypothetical protein